MLASPFAAGAVQLIVAEGSSALTGFLVTRGAAGWAGGPAGTTGEEVPDQSEGCSADECACTAKVYAVPLVKPVHVYEVPVMPGFSVTPPAAGLIRTV